ncbi:peroxiredoxin-2e-2 chloroplastic [Phtheirospermum japonicum]|uniref:Peroxiredoxin-2e-2 chloroplastic n=1 Tax=Phtheirospermum japonicum TaxID=374723 RepID=A0A830DCX1_9LAMI|nr:peroxiredoxin-2e-2 chloroplastic [Phtheirospermum japonicum]
MRLWKRLSYFDASGDLQTVSVSGLIANKKKHYPRLPRHVHPLLLAEAPPRHRPVSRRAQGPGDKHHCLSLGQRFTARNLHTTIWKN